MDLDTDVHGLQELVGDLTTAGPLAGLKAYGATYRAASELRDLARTLAGGLRHAPHYPRSITADTEVEDGEIVGRVGPDKDLKQGPLGNILEYGTVNNPPNAHLGPAFDRVLPGWVDEVRDIAGDIL